jgi:hypothetical protein
LATMLCEHVVSDQIRAMAQSVNDPLYPEIECMLEVPACTKPKSSASTGPSLPRLQVPCTSTRLACVAECGQVLDPHAVSMFAVSMFVCAYECAGWLLIYLLSVAAIEVSAREHRAVMGTTRQGGLGSKLRDR